MLGISGGGHPLFGIDVTGWIMLGVVAIGVAVSIYGYWHFKRGRGHDRSGRRR